jgi:hypothetical protein
MAALAGLTANSAVQAHAVRFDRLTVFVGHDDLPLGVAAPRSRTTCGAQPLSSRSATDGIVERTAQGMFANCASWQLSRP